MLRKSGPERCHFRHRATRRNLLPYGGRTFPSLRWSIVVRKLYFIGLLGLILLEVANVYFIMPMPGSQRIRSIEWAYRVYAWRWVLRAICGLCMATGLRAMWRARWPGRVLTTVSLLIATAVVYAFNFRLAADHMFLQPTALHMESSAHNVVALDRLVVGVAINGEARAYPLQFIGYHHQVRDSVGGQPVLVTYCTVCRTGRAFTPAVNGVPESFRLVGMDHFNALLEDHTTRSWWRQANGEAIVGTRKGAILPELPSRQVTLRQWLALYPQSLVMQGDRRFANDYAQDYAYERGLSHGALTGTDSASWQEKSWVVGLTVNAHNKAYDWNRLQRERLVHDVVGGRPILLVLSPDNASFFAFERPKADVYFVLRNDSLVSATAAYALTGHGAGGTLTAINASQEYWHSWRNFHATTDRY